MIIKNLHIDIISYVWICEILSIVLIITQNCDIPRVIPLVVPYTLLVQSYCFFYLFLSIVLRILILIIIFRDHIILHHLICVLTIIYVLSLQINQQIIQGQHFFVLKIITNLIALFPKSVKRLENNLFLLIIV